MKKTATYFFVFSNTFVKNPVPLSPQGRREGNGINRECHPVLRETDSKDAL
jgi:hypothetical protein